MLWNIYERNFYFLIYSIILSWNVGMNEEMPVHFSGTFRYLYVDVDHKELDDWVWTIHLSSFRVNMAGLGWAGLGRCLMKWYEADMTGAGDGGRGGEGAVWSWDLNPVVVVIREGDITTCSLAPDSLYVQLELIPGVSCLESTHAEAVAATRAVQ